MSPEQIRAIIEEAIAYSIDQQKWTAVIVVSIVMVIVGLLGNYLGAWASIKGKNLATRQDIAELTRIAREIESQYRWKEKITTDSLNTITDILDKMEFVRHNYGKIRAGLPNKLTIVNGDTEELTNINQLLDLRRHLIGEDLYVLLRHRYDQLCNLWRVELNWEQEMKNWNQKGIEINALLAQKFSWAGTR